MRQFDRDCGVNRCKVLTCMAWIGSGVLRKITGGVPNSVGLIEQATAQEARGLTFLQISNSHIGLDFKSAYPNALATLGQCIVKTKGADCYSFDANDVHFTALVNVHSLKAGGLGKLGHEQLEWLDPDLEVRSAFAPIVVFAHVPLWTVAPTWGWSTDDGALALSYLKRFGSVRWARATLSIAFPQPAPGTAPSPERYAARRREPLGSRRF